MIKQSYQRNGLLPWIIGFMLLAGGAIGLILVAAEQGALPGDPLAEPLPVVVLYDLNGAEVTLSDLAGQRLLINFWATWCPPCITEMPELEALHRGNEGRNFAVVAVNNAENEEVIQQFIEANDLTMMVLRDPEGRALQAMGIEYLPTSVFVDSEGTVRGMYQGVLSGEQMVEVARRLK